MKYTLKRLYSDGRVDVVFDVDKRCQNLSLLHCVTCQGTGKLEDDVNCSRCGGRGTCPPPVDNLDLLTRSLCHYGEAYQAGLTRAESRQATPIPSHEVLGLLDATQETV